MTKTDILQLTFALLAFKISNNSLVNCLGPSSNVMATFPGTVHREMTAPKGKSPNTGRGTSEVSRPEGHALPSHAGPKLNWHPGDTQNSPPIPQVP